MLFPRHLVSFLAIVSTLALAGCVGSSEAPALPSATDATAPPSTSSSPLSEEELLAESVQVINDYNSTLIQVLSDHSVDASLLSPYATAGGVDQARAAQDKMAAEGKQLSGNQSISNALLQESDADGAHLTVLTCDEFGEVRVMKGGVDATPPDRRSRSTRQVTLTREKGVLLVERSVVWEGAGICE